jgi:antitoxin component HigA of HigAB toxin-antitoxin module
MGKKVFIYYNQGYSFREHFIRQGESMGERVEILKDWMAQEERGPVWVARKVGRTKSYISHILHGRMPMTDKLARALKEKLGVPLPKTTSDKTASQVRVGK